jgi:hypothetical protein
MPFHNGNCMTLFLNWDTIMVKVPASNNSETKNSISLEYGIKV